jgi:glyoxylase-like metal-dependent hydrolase (beta-lactamase superfamily II)
MGDMPYEGVIEGVFQVGGQGLSGPGDCCIYLIDAGDGTSVLIDSGLGTDPEALFRNIEETGQRLDKVKALILTHCHIDHIGGAVDIIERTGCEVVAHEGDVDAISSGIGSKTAAEAYGVGSPEVNVTRVVESDGGILNYGGAHIIVIHTPGHTPGDISLQMERDGRMLLFANDVHGPFRHSWGSDLDAWRRSMNRLIAVAPDILLEGHFGVIQPRGSAIEFIKEMLSQDMHVQ